MRRGRNHRGAAEVGRRGRMGDILLQFVQAVCLILILKKVDKR